MHVGMRLLAAAVVSAAAAATAAAPLAGDKSKSSPPNIMWMHVESTDGRLYNDDSPVPIPHIRSVQKRGVNFVNFYANVPICCPSRASVWSKFPLARHAHARAAAVAPPRPGTASACVAQLGGIEARTCAAGAHA